MRLVSEMFGMARMAPFQASLGPLLCRSLFKFHMHNCNTLSIFFKRQTDGRADGLTESNTFEPTMHKQRWAQKVLFNKGKYFVNNPPDNNKQHLCR